MKCFYTTASSTQQTRIAQQSERDIEQGLKDGQHREGQGRSGASWRAEDGSFLSS